MNQHILIVEDEAKLASLLQDYLTQSGFTTDILYDGSEVGDWLDKHTTSLILLDLMLPGKTGVDICKDVRKESDLPIIMTTGYSRQFSPEQALNSGIKKFAMKPLTQARLAILVREVLDSAKE